MNKLAYFNLFLIMAYLLIYLRSGNFNSSTGGLAVIIFHWLGLRSYETDNYEWGWWHYAVAGWILYFIGTVTYGTINILIPAFEYQFADSNTITLVTMSTLLSLSVIFYLIIYAKKNFDALKNRPKNDRSN